jgi:hypothetical protein
MDAKEKKPSPVTGDLNSSMKPVGNKIVTTHGYAGGETMGELIGAKKVDGPEV